MAEMRSAQNPLNLLDNSNAGKQDKRRFPVRCTGFLLFWGVYTLAVCTLFISKWHIFSFPFYLMRQINSNVEVNQMNWLNNLFSNPDGMTPWWGILLAIAIIFVIGAAIATVIILVVNAVRKNTEHKELTHAQWTTRELIFGALCIAIAFVLSYLKFFEMPQGGTITPGSMLPIMMFAYIYGTPKGLIVGLAYGLLQLLQDAYIVHWAQLMADYMLAFMALSLAGLFRKNILPGVILGGLGRLFFAFLSGMIFFGEYAAPGQSVAAYSFIYNISYIGPDTVICFMIALIPGIRKAIDMFKAQNRKKIAQPA